MIDGELVVIINCAPDYGPGVWTVIIISGLFLFQSERLFGLSDVATSNHQQKSEGKAGITIRISQFDVSISFILVTISLFNPFLIIYFMHVLKTKYKGRRHQIVKLHQQRERQ